MAISSTEAQKIHSLAQQAGIDDETLADWTEEEGGYRFAITSHRGSIKSAGAHALRRRIANHAASSAAASASAEPEPASTPAEPLATERQVEFILDLLAQRVRSGEGGGFYSGPTDRAGIAAMTRREASLYITSLKGDY